MRKRYVLGTIRYVKMYKAHNYKFIIRVSRHYIMKPINTNIIYFLY